MVSKDRGRMTSWGLNLPENVLPDSYIMISYEMRVYKENCIPGRGFPTIITAAANVDSDLISLFLLLLSNVGPKNHTRTN